MALAVSQHDLFSSSPSLLSASVAEPSSDYAPLAASPAWVEALVDCPGAQGLYTYAIPPDESVAPGDILSVPFGAQQVGAIAIRLLVFPPEEIDTHSIKAIEGVMSRGFFPPRYWELLQRIADYYCTPLIQVIRMALPPGLLRRSQRRIRLLPDAIPAGAVEFLTAPARQLIETLQNQPQGDYTWVYLQRQVRGAYRGLRDLLQRGWVESYLAPPTPVRPKRQRAVTLIDGTPIAAKLSPRQQEVLDLLRRQGGDAWLQDLLQLARTSSSVVQALEQKGCVVVQDREVLRRDRPSPGLQTDQPQRLTPDQEQAVAAIANLSGAAQLLLHGVTGSGKTEVYLQAIAPILAQGKSALVLVPEIGLTPQLTDRFRARFGDRVLVYHSGLSEGERYDTWRQMLVGTPQVVIGTRSAIFAPLPQIGLIVLDEEHDSSFKQDQPAPCYHARTVAQWRTELSDCPLILGTATPSLESWQMVQEAKSEPIPTQYCSLPQRVHARPLPPIEVVDMRHEFRCGNRSIFSRSLHDALEALKEKQQQGILFIHRRGHSTFVSCRSCGEAMNCPHCDVSLTFHQAHEQAAPTLRCHYCGFGRSHPPQCPHCDSPYLKHFGSGTQRVMQELSREFPQLRCLRFDRDTTRTKGAHRALLTRFVQGDADLLIGTQMLAKGLDIPQVTLIGIVAADGLLNLADFRAGERAYQILTQVSGRAGRGEEPGHVILQTYAPEHPVIQAVQRQDYEAFVATELGDRAALHYPPYGQLIVLRLSSPDESAVQQAAEQIAEAIRLSNPEDLAYTLLGPAPAAVMRVARRYRWQILLKCPSNTAQQVIQILDLVKWRSRISNAVSLTIDVDPLQLL